MWMASCMFCMKFKCIKVSVDCSRANRMNKMLLRSVHMPCISTYMWTNSQRKRSEAVRNGIDSEMKCFYCQKLFKIQFEIWTLRSKHSNLTITIFRWNFIRTGCVCVLWYWKLGMLCMLVPVSMLIWEREWSSRYFCWFKHKHTPALTIKFSKFSPSRKIHQNQRDRMKNVSLDTNDITYDVKTAMGIRMQREREYREFERIFEMCLKNGTLILQLHQW